MVKVSERRTRARKRGQGGGERTAWDKGTRYKRPEGANSATVGQ